MKFKKFTIAFAILLVSSILVGCTPKQVSNVGTVILSVNPSIAINYDKDGLVSSIDALNEDGKAIIKDFKGYEGKEAKFVIADVVKLIGDAGYLVDDIENGSRKITIELEDDSVLPTDAFIQEIASSIKDYLNSVEHKNVIRYKKDGTSDYLDFSDYFVVSDYDDSDYEKEETKKPVVPNKPKDTDYSDYDDSDYSDYSDFDDSDYDDSDYDDSDYDDSDYDDSDYDN